MTKTLLVDYGSGNLLSVSRALVACGADVDISGDARDIEKAERVLLPGVGAFGDCMRELQNRGMDDALRAFAALERPFLGICVGMQMLLESGEEFGHHQGLGLIPGKVEAIPATGIDGVSHKIPHVGWSEIMPPDELRVKPSAWDGTILDGLEAAVAMYFIHSYAARPTNDVNLLAKTCYNGRDIGAVVRSGNLYGTQFHPEKSGQAGLKVLNNFLKL